MLTWRDVVKKHSKPGQSLKDAMNAASKEWKEMKRKGTAGVAISKVPMKSAKRTRKAKATSGDKKACLGSGGSTWRDVVKKHSAPGRSMKDAMKAASKEWKDMKRKGTACTGGVTKKRKRKGQRTRQVPVSAASTAA